MIITTPQELRLYLPSHVLNNLETMAGFIDNSEHDFLAERIGMPLLRRLNEQYRLICEREPDWPSTYVGTPGAERDIWLDFLVLCQRCVVFDAFARAADINAVSVNDAGLNIAEAQGYDAAGDKAIERYKKTLIKESHAASNRMLVALEQWQQSLPDIDAGEGDGADSRTDREAGEGDPETLAKREIVSLWRESAYYYFADGLLFNTATEFGLYVDIYNSREKFICLLPDIRYCQETFIEAEIGSALLQDLIEKHRQGKLNAIEQTLYTKLQRILSLKVEHRSKLIYRPNADKEADGHIGQMLRYLYQNQTSLNPEAMKHCPVYDPRLWSDEAVGQLKAPKPKYLDDYFRRSTWDCQGDGMLISSMI